ncbi:hypothetical protein FH972_024155 [Carpinus fangiana]|uniref:Uncharacterized protein n=1 Tax=Carpinus fangiana TaxID=176857 RepID=A0A5N6KX77_9ROSI|nr:hypothetical protein FH972_024155 [Carpinus fangiana]
MIQLQGAAVSGSGLTHTGLHVTSGQVWESEQGRGGVARVSSNATFAGRPKKDREATSQTRVET